MTAPSLECLLRMAEVLDIDLDPQETNVVDLDDHRHGTEAGHEQHMRDGETSCDACIDGKNRASRRRTKRKAMGYRYTLPLGEAHAVVARWRAAGASLDDIAEHTNLHQSQVWRVIHGTPADVVYTRTWLAIMDVSATSPVTPAGVTRRIQALTWMGYTVQAIADAAGCHHDSVVDARDEPRLFQARKVRDGIVAAYNQLHMVTPTGHTKQYRAGITRAKNRAIREGWLPPLAWADIDLGTVAETQRVSRLTWFDEVRVVRIIEGDGSLAAGASRPERLEVIRRWRALGRSDGALERLTGWQHLYLIASQDAAA